MSLYGLPQLQTNPKFDKRTFCTYIPKLKDWVYEPANQNSYQKFLDVCNKKINIGVFCEDWEYAISLAIAHYICITDPDYAQAIGADTASGGVMSSRSVGNISYTYDVDKTVADNPAYKFWLRTGYGAQLVNLALLVGWVGAIIVQ